MSGYKPERRGGRRIACVEDYFLYRGVDQKVECTLKNISVTGACILTDAEMRLEEEITLHICSGSERDVPLESKVVWKTGEEYGLLFALDSQEAFENISYVINNRC